MPEISELKGRSTVVRLISIIGLLASIAALFSLYFQIKKPRRELEATVVNTEHVSTLPKITGLSLALTFNGKKLDDFWIARVQIRNSGDVTLIGKGPSKSILSEGISLMFPAEFEILDMPKPAAETLLSPPPMFSYGLRQTSQNAFAIDFGQWRVGETVDATFYLARRAGASNPPTLRVPDREIIDGDVRPSQAETRTVRSNLDLLPPAVSRVVRIMAIISEAAALLFVAVGSVIGWTEYLKSARWKKRHINDFITQINGQATISELEKKLYVESPDKVPARVWEALTVSRPPSNLIFSSWPGGLAFTACMIFLAISFAAGLAALS